MALLRSFGQLVVFFIPAPISLFAPKMHSSQPEIDPVQLREILFAIHYRLAVVSNFKGSIQKLLRSEEHTSEFQSRFDLVCRLLLEKKKKKNSNKHTFNYKKNILISLT